MPTIHIQDKNIECVFLNECIVLGGINYMEVLIVRLSLLRKTILIPEYLAFMCVCVFVDGCISQF